ncbi:MAG: elongator complex protein 3 [Eggerthellaceae bacterium]
MDTILLEIIEEIRRGTVVDHKVLARILHEHNKDLKDNRDHFAKKHLLPYYFNAKNTKEELWRSWNVDEQTERALIAALQMKPRRTASGVATITVITKPWFCGNDCLYCPNDVRMPKSYLHNEPACQRAERNWFDPYLQVASRLRALSQMGHPTDKIELIVLGGTWDDYPSEYRIWFMAELFRALNDGDAMEAHAAQRRAFYREAGILNDEQRLASAAKDLQEAVNDGKSSFADALRALYGNNTAWAKASAMQHATLEEVDRLQEENERARHRCVGLVVETRPETITVPKLALLRRLGCTKAQIGIQSLDQNILDLNNRHTDPHAIQEAFALLRLFGFKIHAHFMVNLYGATPAGDKLDYEKFVTDPHCLPDEVKLYPCALVEERGLFLTTKTAVGAPIPRKSSWTFFPTTR